MNERKAASPLAYAGILLRLAVLGAALGWVAYKQNATPKRKSPAPVARLEAAAPPKAPMREPDVSHQVRFERVEQARSELDGARAERASAERLVEAAKSALGASQLEAARAMAETRALSRTLKDASPRIARASGRVVALQSRKQAVDAEIAALERAPKPRPKPLIDKSPVSRPPRGAEYHFELRDDRVAYINMKELLERLKVDARIQIRMMTIPRPVSGEAGPVGDFAIRYELVPVGMALSGRYGAPSLDAEFTLSGYEIVPFRPGRGETLKSALEPASDFGRAVNQLDPSRDTITMWVYPDAFDLFRQLREALQRRGFQVAARPLPAEMPIRGSPNGSISAAQ